MACAHRRAAANPPDSYGENSALLRLDNGGGIRYNRGREITWGVRNALAFTHIIIKGFRVGMQMSSPHRFGGTPGEGSKQPQVSALPSGG